MTTHDECHSSDVVILHVMYSCDRHDHFS
jgi:hypothetical protein